MRQFVYISTADRLSGDDLDAILASSKRNNEVAAITGFLLYNGRNFLQLIEGDEPALMTLMRCLVRDPRHSGIVRLHDEPIAARDCPEWAMHRLRLSEVPAERTASLESELPRSLAPEVRKLVANFAALN